MLQLLPETRFFLGLCAAVIALSVHSWAVRQPAPEVWAHANPDERVERMQAALSAAMQYECSDTTEAHARIVDLEHQFALSRLEVDALEKELAWHSASDFEDGTHLVPREMLEELMSQGSRGTARVVPHLAGTGEIDGYRLSGLRRDSLARTLGLRNGDVVHGVDDIDFVSVEGVLRTWQDVLEGGTFELHLTRNGEARVLDYIVF